MKKKIKIMVIKIIEKIFFFYYNFHIKKKINYQKEFKKIALILTSPLGIGDLIMATPFIKTMRKNFPHAEIHLITDKDIFEVEGLKEITSIKLIKGNLKQLKRECKKLSSEKYDLGVIINRAVNQVFYINALNPKFKIGYLGGYKIQANFKLKDENLYFKKEEHFSKMSLNIANAMNLKVDKSLIYPKYSKKIIDSTSKKFKKLKLNKNLPLIGLNTNVQWESRKWDEENYINLITDLHEKFNFILLGGPGNDVQLNKKIISILLRKGIEIIDLSGQFSLKESIYLMSKLDFLVTADSGPMHFGLMMRTPTLGLFGPVNPKHRLPMNNDCIVYSLWYHDYKKGRKYDYESEHVDKEMNGLKVIPVNDVKKIILKFFKIRKLE